MHRKDKTTTMDARAPAAGSSPAGGVMSAAAHTFRAYLGFVGASAAAGGLLQLLEPASSGSWALATAVGGLALAVAAWLRGAARAETASFFVGPDVTRLGRHARDCAELAAWPSVAGSSGSFPHR